MDDLRQPTDEPTEADPPRRAQKGPAMSETTRVTYWTVDKVTGDRQQTTADLVQVDWYKPDPADPENSFIDVTPDEEGADAIDLDGRLHLDITAGPALTPHQNVKITIELLS